jgi:hypothetical protein
MVEYHRVQIFGDLKVPFKQEADGTIVTKTTVTFGAGTPILKLGRYSGADAGYQELTSWTVGVGKTGVLKEIAFTYDPSGEARYQITIGASVISDFNPVTNGSFPFSPNRLTAGTIVKIEVKSSAGATITVTGSITGDEE